MPDMCPFEKKEKEVFFRLPTFFFRNKKKISKEQLLFSFLCIIMQKKILERSKKVFFENLLSIRPFCTVLEYSNYKKLLTAGS